MQMHRLTMAVLLAAMLPLAACGDFLEVTNPGPIEDENLNVPEAMDALVTGMSADLSDGFGDLVYATSMMADELAHGGSYTQEGLWYRGIINPEDVNSLWADAHRARWTAENGIERLQQVLGATWDKTVLGARANLYAGFANRTLGENMCHAVISVGQDPGKQEDHAVHFSRAETYFTEALRIAQATSQTGLANAALAGRASVRAWQGKWAEAVQDAQQVPTAFVFEAVYHPATDYEQNDLVSESNTTVGRRELTVFGTLWAARDPQDPRTPWIIPLDKGGKPMRGQDGKTTFYQQMKFTDLGSEIPLAKGTEMLVLRAEAALRNGDIAGAMELINAMRAFHKLPALPTPATLEEAWDVLQVERGAVVWLEARRLWDLRRWHAAGAGSPAYHPFLEGRDKCIPISRNEQESNPNLQG